jgi:hypothetical protein
LPTGCAKRVLRPMFARESNAHCVHRRHYCSLHLQRREYRSLRSQRRQYRSLRSQREEHRSLRSRKTILLTAFAESIAHCVRREDNIAHYVRVRQYCSLRSRRASLIAFAKDRMIRHKLLILTPLLCESHQALVKTSKPIENPNAPRKMEDTNTELRLKRVL